MHTSFKINSCKANVKLNKNMQVVNNKLLNMMGCCEMEQPQENPDLTIVQKQLRDFNNLHLSNDAPQFEFHTVGCYENQAFVNSVLQERKIAGAENHSRSSCADMQSVSESDYQLLATRQTRQQQQQQIVWSNEYQVQRSITEENLRELGLNGNCQFEVLRLMSLFNSMHDHLNTDLPSSQSNAFPSGYLFDFPKKYTLPNNMNVRHQVNMLYSKTERFLMKQRRILVSNQHFDFCKYSECDDALKNIEAYLVSLKRFTYIDLRHREGKFVNEAAREKALELENLLLGLQKWIDTAYLYVHVFNWEMDNEHRFSLSMSQRRDATKQLATQIAAADIQASEQSKVRSPDEQMLAETYGLDNLLKCAQEHDEFLTNFMQQPELYFLPETVALYDSKTNAKPALPMENEYENPVADYVQWGDILEPTSPPKTTIRSHQPLVYRG